MKHRRYPVTTGLQAWTVALVTQLRAAREQLHPDEWEALVALVIVAVASEATEASDPARLREAA